MNIQGNSNRRHLAIALILVGLVSLAVALFSIAFGFLQYVPSHDPLSLGTVSGDILVQIPYDSLPKDALYITNKRRSYTGEMKLIIPSIEVDTSVGASTLPDGLRIMPGLYEFSQMPDEAEGNVSIAGHRDIYDMVFLHLDQMRDGDYLYLIYENTVYRYLYKETQIVGPSHWEVIRRQGYTAITLTTCDPIGTARNRLVVTGEQQDVYTLKEDTIFLANQANTLTDA